VWPDIAIRYRRRPIAFTLQEHQMSKHRRTLVPGGPPWYVIVSVVCLYFVAGQAAAAQTLTGALIGTVEDSQGGVLPGALVRVSSAALIGGPKTVTTNDKGQLRFPALPPGSYVLEVTFGGFESYREQDIRIGVAATLERAIVLTLTGVIESVVVDHVGSRLEARDPGLGTRFGLDDLRTIPTRRSSMFDLLRAAPGMSPTSPASGTITGVSAFGSGTNENTFLIDGTNFTSASNGMARADPGIDFLQEIHVQSVGASAEYGNVQGAVVNVVTRQGGNRLQFDASYYAQPASLTSQPVRLPIPGSDQPDTGYERVRYRDFGANLGGPILRDRIWFFTGYQYLRDYDSQPGTDPRFPRKSEQDKVFTKLTWRLAQNWELVQSIHNESWVNPELPTFVRPFETTLRLHGSVPAVTFGHLRYTSANTVSDVRVGRFSFSQYEEPTVGNGLTPSRLDQPANVTRDAPPQIGEVLTARWTAKATISRYRANLFGADHEWKTGGQIERGEHRSLRVVPTGVRFVYVNGQPSQSIAIPPSNAGGRSMVAGTFITDTATFVNRLTVSAGLRFDRGYAISQDLRALDAMGQDTGETIAGLGTLYTTNVLSPRLGVTAKLTDDGRMLLRASYGRYSQGILTGELSQLHPGVAPTTTTAFDAATGAYTGTAAVVDSRRNLVLDPNTRTPRTDEYSIGVDRELGRQLAVTLSYVRKEGADFIGWTDVGGQYRQETRTLRDGRTVPVLALSNSPAARRFLLTNPDGYSMTYNGLVLVVQKRPSHGWQAFGSYTASKASGLQASSGATAAGEQVSTVGSPPIFFGRDPNDLTNARGRLPNDRPHVFRLMGSVDVPTAGLTLAANFQHFSGKPWAETALVSLPQNANQRVLLEPRGSRRLSTQSLLDVRLLKTMRVGALGRVDVLVDVLNALNDAAEESLASDNVLSSNFMQPTVFMDPRRAVLSVRLNLGQ
jgi:hypothetical protein